MTKMTRTLVNIPNFFNYRNNKHIVGDPIGLDESDTISTFRQKVIEACAPKMLNYVGGNVTLDQIRERIGFFSLKRVKIPLIFCYCIDVFLKQSGGLQLYVTAQPEMQTTYSSIINIINTYTSEKSQTSHLQSPISHLC